MFELRKKGKNIINVKTGGYNGCELQGRDGLCYCYDEKPELPVFIKGDLVRSWKETSFLLDSGADLTLVHFDEAEDLGIDVSHSLIDTSGQGVMGKLISLYIKQVEIKIGNLPSFFIDIAFSKDIKPNTRLLGRKTFMDIFGIAMTNKTIGIFPYKIWGD